MLRLKQTLVIPAGTLFGPAAEKTVLAKGHLEAILGFGRDASAHLVVDPTDGGDTLFEEFDGGAVPPVDLLAQVTDAAVSEAERCYRVYGAVTDFKNFQGNPMPDFADLPPKIQEAWGAVATHLVATS
jgi:hypothetical protein